MNVLVACEESGVVCKSFRDLGHNAFSVDLKPTSGTLPQYHFIGNCLDYLDFLNWDLLIAFPPCTYFSRVNFLNYYRNGVFNSKRFEFRSKTYIGVAQAMASQWGCL